MAHGSYDVPRGLIPRGLVLRRLVPWGRVPLALLVVAALLAGCASMTPTAGHHRHHRPGSHHSASHHHHRSHHPTHQPSTTSTASTPSNGALPASAAQALAELGRLVVRPRPQGTLGYVRDAFGTSWADTDHNGCNQRDDVLLRDAVRGTTRVQQQGSCDHDVLAGTWHDPYTGRTLTFTDLKDLSQAEAIQIDHVVPLAEAWVSGADRWTAARRELFANDLGELLAVDGPTNMSKGDGDPAAWRPRKGYQCTYAEHWVAVKSRWSLAVDPPEVAALRQMLAYCP